MQHKKFIEHLKFLDELEAPLYEQYPVVVFEEFQSEKDQSILNRLDLIKKEKIEVLKLFAADLGFKLKKLE